MADDTQTSDKPSFIAPGKSADPVLLDKGDSVVNLNPPRETPAVDRLRAFEDEAFKGSQIQVVRIGDRIERGVGSAFAALSPEKKRQYAALEKLVEAEQKLADAHAAVIQAEADHEAALADAEPKPDAE